MQTVTVLADDLLWPTNSGGRLALLREIRALKAGGLIVKLIVFYRDRAIAEREAYAAIADEVLFIRRRSLARTLAFHPWLPHQVSSRALNPNLIPKSFADCDLVIAHHEWTLLAAKDLQSINSNLRVVLRSHNDEIEYMSILARSGHGFRRMYSWLEKVRLKFNIKKLLQIPDLVGLISPEDRQVYERFALETFELPPVLLEAGEKTVVRSKPEKPDLLFVGALDMPQIEEGILWFAREVMPQLLKTSPTARLVVVGRRGRSKLRESLRTCQGVEFLGEVENTDSLYRSSSVFINPVFSGSGVSMKLAQPATAGLPIVSTAIGCRGLPKLSGELLIAENIEAWVQACRTLLGNDSVYAQASSRSVRGIKFYSSENYLESILALDI